MLIAIEVAACLTLLVGAGLTIQSALGMLRVDMGLDADDVVVGRFSLRQRAYPDAAARTGFYERVLARSGEIAGAQGIAFTNSWPLQQSMTRDVGAGESTGPSRCAPASSASAPTTSTCCGSRFTKDACSRQRTASAPSRSRW